MRINTNDVNAISGFYAVNFETFAHTLEGSEIACSYEMGGGVAIHYGSMKGNPIWLMENACGTLYGIWVEDNEHPDSN